MKYMLAFLFSFLAASAADAGGEAVAYKVNGQPYEGHFVTPSPGASLVLLVHDWDGLTDYEIRRAGMLAEVGYAVFAADLFGVGGRPIRLEDKRQHTGELYTDHAKMRTLLQGAFDAAQSRGADIRNAVAMGYCFGGTSCLSSRGQGRCSRV